MLVVLCASSMSQAGGFWTLDRGPSHFARGGASFNQPLGPIAIYTNPAALADLKGLQLNLDANTILDMRSFIRADHNVGTEAKPTLRTYAPSENQTGWGLPSPGVFISYNLATLGLETLSLGMAIYGPPKVDVSYPEGITCVDNQECTGSQRFSLIEAHNLQIHGAFAAGCALPWWGLKIGFNFMLVRQIVDTSLALQVKLVPGPDEDEKDDIKIEVNASESWIPTGILAITAQPTPWLSVALSYQHHYNVSADGTALITSSGTLAESITGDKLKVGLQMPSITRTAIQYRDPKQRYDIEAAFVWERWSRNKTIDFEPIDIESIVGPIDTVQLKNNWQDSFSIRLGTTVWLLPELLRIHAGTNFEKSAVPDENLNAGSLDLDKWGVTTGVTVNLPAGLWVDLALGYTYWQSKKISESKVTLVNALAPDSEGYPIGNGSYSNQQVALHLGLGVKFDI
jgi:long-subunit fatty acid transport protein